MAVNRKKGDGEGTAEPQQGFDAAATFARLHGHRRPLVAEPRRGLDATEAGGEYNRLSVAGMGGKTLSRVSATDLFSAADRRRAVQLSGSNVRRKQ